MSDSDSAPQVNELELCKLGASLSITDVVVDPGFKALEEVLIEGFNHVYGGNVKVDPTFFPLGKDSDKSSYDAPYDSTPPPRDKIIGATSQYLKYLASRPKPIARLVPEFTISDVLSPSNLYWNYPQAVTDYNIFEPQMTPLLPHGGVKKLICKRGTGEHLKPGDKCHVNYYIYVEGCAGCVESNKRLNKPYLVELGRKRGCLPIIDLGTMSMTLKEVSAFLATPNYGFGKFGMGAWISANKRVLCIIEVLGKEPYKVPNSFSMYYMSYMQRKSLSFDEIYMFAVSKKAEGDDRANVGHNARSLRCYFQALTCLYGADPTGEDDMKMLLDLTHALHGNVFLICYRVDLFSIALKFLKRNMELAVSPQKKACDYFCCANMLFEQRNWEKAKFYIDKAVVHLHDNVHVKDLEKRINHAYAVHNKENLPIRLP